MTYLRIIYSKKKLPFLSERKLVISWFAALICNQFAVTNALGLFIAHSQAFIFFVIGITALEIKHFGVAFERQNMRAYTI